MRIEAMDWRERAVKVLWLGMACAMLAACASPRRTPAPVEDRMAAHHAAVSTEAPRAVLPGAENAGKPGYYTVRPGDTLVRIALESGQNWRDIVRWNNLDNPNVIEVGQVLRVAPPAGTAVAAAPAAVAPVAPASAAPAPALPPASGASAARVPVAPAAASSTPASPPPPVATGPDDDIAWAWPTAGAATVLAGFDEQKNKG